MIGYIKGSVEGIAQDYIIVENNGIGYRVYTSGMTINHLNGLHETIQVYTYMHVREDDLSLFGFLTTKELETFKLLISVSGIGPKAALSILSVLSVNDLYVAIMAGDTKAITKANGVGAKGANRVIMELKDKIELEDMFDNGTSVDTVPNVNISNSSSAQDAVMALVSLGYSETEAFRAVKQVSDVDSMDSEEILKQALKKLF